mmetsp:Transcript_75739/g.245150  ORF Transcript_75739/g.245150 Transcript_75739/m.245150 type:complete len:297 (-) Transcript_75739:1080-1970(-)
MTRHEESWVGVGHVDLDAAKEYKVAGSVVCVDDGEHLCLHGIVCPAGKVYHHIAGLGDLSSNRLQLLAEPALHQVFGVRGHARSGRELALGGNDSTTGRRALRLAPAQEPSWLAAGREAYVRPEDDEDVATVWHVVREGHEAGLATVGGTADAPKGECPPVMLGQDGGEVARVAVDLVRADGLAVDGVLPRQAVLLDGPEESRGHIGALHCSREVCLDNPHDVRGGGVVEGQLLVAATPSGAARRFVAARRSVDLGQLPLHSLEDWSKACLGLCLRVPDLAYDDGPALLDSRCDSR